MPKPLTWPEIKQQYPELAARLIAGDMTARAEFARLAFGGEIISEQFHDPARGPKPRPASRVTPPSRPSKPAGRAVDAPSLDIIPTDQAPNPPF